MNPGEDAESEKMKVIGLNLPAWLIAALDEISRAKGVSRSALASEILVETVRSGEFFDEMEKSHLAALEKIRALRKTHEDDTDAALRVAETPEP